MLVSCLKILKELIGNIIDYINDNIETKDEIKLRNERLKNLCDNLLDKGMKTFNKKHIEYIDNYINNIIDNYIKNNSITMDEKESPADKIKKYIQEQNFEKFNELFSIVILETPLLEMCNKYKSMLLIIYDVDLLIIYSDDIDLRYQKLDYDTIKNTNEIKDIIEKSIKVIKTIRDTINKNNFNIDVSWINQREEIIQGYKNLCYRYDDIIQRIDNLSDSEEN